MTKHSFVKTTATVPQFHKLFSPDKVQWYCSLFMSSFSEDERDVGMSACKGEHYFI